MRADGKWEMAVTEDELAIPALVQGRALRARLDRLDPSSREVLSIAAVIGRTFRSSSTPSERLVPREQLRPALTELQRLDLIVEVRRRPNPGTASVTASSRRSPTRASSSRPGRSSTSVWEKR